MERKNVKYEYLRVIFSDVEGLSGWEHDSSLGSVPGMR